MTTCIRRSCNRPPEEGRVTCSRECLSLHSLGRRLARLSHRGRDTSKAAEFLQVAEQAIDAIHVLLDIGASDAA